MTRLDGLYVGQLTKTELEAFARCVCNGTHYRDYGSVGGFLGMAKVRRVTDQQSACNHVTDSPKSDRL